MNQSYINKELLDLIMSTETNCEHFIGIDENNVIAIRMCLICGHVGCCDSSIGLHATKHFQKTGHTVMAALPNKPWKWCYVHKQYY
jgi:uncharacterized UBP type Zn finger protein